MLLQHRTKQQQIDSAQIVWDSEKQAIQLAFVPLDDALLHSEFSHENHFNFAKFDLLQQLHDE